MKSSKTLNLSSLSMINEAWLSRGIRENWSGLVQSFEHCGSKAVPDLCWMIQGETIWIELKQIGKRTDKLPFRNGQTLWLDSVNKQSVKTRVVVAIKDKGGYRIAIVRAATMPWQNIARLPFNEIPLDDILLELNIQRLTWGMVQDACRALN